MRVISGTEEPSLIDSTFKFSKNYQIGQKLSAFVGQPIVKVKNYKVHTYNSQKMKASDSFNLVHYWTGSFTESDSYNISVNSAQEYNVNGVIEWQGNKYTVIEVKPRQFVMVKPDGSIVPFLYSSSCRCVLTRGTLSNSNVRFTPITTEEIDVGDGYLNYELMFGGTDGKSINISYREYSADDFARPAFQQNLVYEIGNNNIRFQNTVIKVHKIENDQIVYTVLSDGL